MKDVASRLRGQPDQTRGLALFDLKLSYGLHATSVTGLAEFTARQMIIMMLHTAAVTWPWRWWRANEVSSISRDRKPLRRASIGRMPIATWSFGAAARYARRGSFRRPESQ
jgi:hypothetical protein